MHQKRQQMSKRLPLPRKGTKYVVRAASHHNMAVPVLIAVRDMLNLAESAREVKLMIHNKKLKINGRQVRDMHESITLFGQLEADKPYCLTLLTTGKFAFKELKKPEDKLLKVTNKRLVSGGKIQLNLYDGTNIITSDKTIAINDSLYLDEKNKVKKHLAFEKGKNVFIIKGKHQGTTAKVLVIKGKEVTIEYNGEQSTLINDALIVTN